MTTFYDKLTKAVKSRDSWLCVGLDFTRDRLPSGITDSHLGCANFLKNIVLATQNYTASYKFNLAYFECLGPKGLHIMEEVLAIIPKDIIKLGDAKRADVGHSAEKYAQTLFEYYGFDAVTVNPYMGYDALAPFFAYADKGVYVLCLTSNEGAEDFQIPHQLYLKVARSVKKWNSRQNCGLVVGATHPEYVKEIRENSGPMPFLIPGVGAQGGDLAATLQHAYDGTSISGLVNASRSILYASRDTDYEAKASQAAYELHMQINEIRATLQS